LRYFDGAVQELALVTPSDLPAGDRFIVNKNGTLYAAWLVDVSDPNASPVRIMTSEGLKAFRKYT